jgi:hypothetical protein
MPIRCRKCGNEVKASQAMGTLDMETMLEFQKRMKELCGDTANPWMLELDPWYMEKAARDANSRGYACGKCGTKGDWEAGIST